jgi:hypothetical protein
MTWNASARGKSSVARPAQAKSPTKQNQVALTKPCERDDLGSIHCRRIAVRAISAEARGVWVRGGRGVPPWLSLIFLCQTVPGDSRPWSTSRAPPPKGSRDTNFGARRLLSCFAKNNLGLVEYVSENQS